MKIQLDKIAHALACYAAVMTFVLAMPLLYAVIITLVVGAGKEWYDHKHPFTHTADPLDFLADAIGVAAASLVLLAPLIFTLLKAQA
jgi:hypothetical protein